MISTPRISIIMPVFNAGGYLRESIQSIINQEYRDFELLCIDDCSTDPLTCAILDEFEKRDARIKVTHLEKNCGAGGARNVGIDQAQGEYLQFVDADDQFDSDMLLELYEQIIKFDADMCVCGNRVFSNITGKETAQWIPKEITNGGGVNRPFSMRELGPDGLKYYALVPWNRMIHRRLIDSNRLRFSDFASYEDCCFADLASLLSTSIVYADGGRPLISYRYDNPNQRSVGRRLRDHLNYLKQLWDARQKVAEIWELQQIQMRFVGRVLISLKYTDISLEEKADFYESVQIYVRTAMPVNYLDKVAKRRAIYLDCLRDLSFETEWYYKPDMTYEDQIEWRWWKLMDEIGDSTNNLMIWGYGDRGKSVYQVLKRHGVNVTAIVDGDDTRQSQLKKLGYPIIRNEDISEDMVIIATNDRIYDDLKEMNDQYKLIRLEKYCPLVTKRYR